jgi:acetoin utilization deacetylase AcuC-like enzyme
MPRVGLYDDPLFREHDSGPGHPERPERLDAIRAGLRAAGLERELRLLAPRAAGLDELARVHAGAHVERVAATRGRGARFDADTQAGPRSYEAAVKAAGGALDAVERVLGGDLRRAYCLARPPGHHAEAGRAMGFCLFNNVAVAAAHALARGLTRVLIVDFDVHHGNGTQALFYDDPRVLYVSSHAWPFYPGTGAVDELGEGAGAGFTLNLPLPMGLGDAEYTALYREIVAPVTRAFDPELVLVSAGFDAYRDDPLAGMRLTAAGYAELTRVCLEAAEGAAGGRAVFLLEGGYSLEGLALGSQAIVEGLLERATPRPRVTEPLPRAEALVAVFRRAFAPHWPVLAARE